MDPGWFILFLFLVVEILLVTLLCLPMPSNDIRGMITTWVASLWDAKPVQYVVYGLLAIDVFYFYFVFHALWHPLHDFGMWTPIEMGISCEQKQDLYNNERNAYITGGGIFMFFILNRLVDIQDKLHKSRHQVKSGATPGNVSGGGGGSGGAPTPTAPYEDVVPIAKEVKKVQ
mmetsp:Transcript_20851/g.28978  ORF Transcript_20851/g.28978 Transcript_20851/m.28978 type:complete len:173 (+) Transcript_20851:109-627(+)